MKNISELSVHQLYVHTLFKGFAIFIFLFLSRITFSQKPEFIKYYLTTPDKSALLALQKPLSFSNSIDNSVPVITIDDNEIFQSMEGFGYALTGGSAILINKMKSETKLKLLRELFGNDDNSIGVSYLRISIGASDLSDRIFSYDDLPEGEVDLQMKRFSIDPERKDLIPVLKLILEINPDIKILGSPWSPPLWMKTTGKSKGGSLKPEFYDAYALYFVKYIESMKAEGIRIDAITIQNEPLYAGNNPSMYMPANEQADFIKKSLGPAFRKAGIDTKIIIYDHNPNRVDYPIEILKDPEASEYVDGSAFHMYEGKVEAISEVHQAFPDKNIYFTEQWVGAPGNFPKDLKWHIKTLIIGAVRNWCRNVIEWNLASDPEQDPHTVGGCTECLGAVTLDGDSVKRNPAYYIIAHASKFVARGSVRIGSNVTENLPNVAFKTPDGKKILIILNDSATNQEFQVLYHEKKFRSKLAAGSVATYFW